MIREDSQLVNFGRVPLSKETGDYCGVVLPECLPLRRLHWNIGAVYFVDYDLHFVNACRQALFWGFWPGLRKVKSRIKQKPTNESGHVQTTFFGASPLHHAEPRVRRWLSAPARDSTSQAQQLTVFTVAVLFPWQPTCLGLWSRPWPDSVMIPTIPTHFLTKPIEKPISNEAMTA